MSHSQIHFFFSCWCSPLCCPLQVRKHTLCPPSRSRSWLSCTRMGLWKQPSLSTRTFSSTRVVRKHISTAQKLDYKSMNWFQYIQPCLFFLLCRQVCTSIWLGTCWEVMPSRSWAGGRRTTLPTGWLPTPGTQTGETKVLNMQSLPYHWTGWHHNAQPLEITKACVIISTTWFATGCKIVFLLNKGL